MGGPPPARAERGARARARPQAHHTFNRYVRDPAFEYRFQLEPGTVLLFDNQRVLHGRTAFTGHRRLIGCYLHGDDYRSRLRGLLAS